MKLYDFGQISTAIADACPRSGIKYMRQIGQVWGRDRKGNGRYQSW